MLVQDYLAVDGHIFSRHLELEGVFVVDHPLGRKLACIAVERDGTDLHRLVALVHCELDLDFGIDSSPFRS